MGVTVCKGNTTMGRPKLVDGNNKAVSFRYPGSEWARLCAFCARLDIPVARFIRDAIREKWVKETERSRAA